MMACKYGSIDIVKLIVSIKKANFLKSSNEYSILKKKN